MLLLAGVSYSVDFSLSSYSSSDELRQALYLDEISYDQYISLIEIYDQFNFSSEPSLYDEIPNLSIHPERLGDFRSSIEKIQLSDVIF